MRQAENRSGDQGGETWQKREEVVKAVGMIRSSQTGPDKRGC